MSTSYYYEMKPIIEEATLPILELSVADPDLQTPVDLTMFSVSVSFWRPGSAIHAVRPGYVYDAANGLARCELDGTEFSGAGECCFQWDLTYPGLSDPGLAQGTTNGVMTSPPFRKRVLARQP